MIESFLVVHDNGFVAQLLPIPNGVAEEEEEGEEAATPLRFHAARLMTRITNYQTMTVAPEGRARADKWATNILGENVGGGGGQELGYLSGLGQKS